MGLQNGEPGFKLFWGKVSRPVTKLYGMDKKLLGALTSSMVLEGNQLLSQKPKRYCYTRGQHPAQSSCSPSQELFLDWKKRPHSVSGWEFKGYSPRAVLTVPILNCCSSTEVPVLPSEGLLYSPAVKVANNHHIKAFSQQQSLPRSHPCLYTAAPILTSQIAKDNMLQILPITKIM